MRQIIFAVTLLITAVTVSSFSLIELGEIGKAGYYADALHGRKTASGELYDKNKLTCAHKSLPFGTMLRVTRLDNKKSVVVRVNDRGPYVDGFIVDLSRKAAEAIDLIREGITKVDVEIIEAAATARVAAETGGNTKLLVARDAAKLPQPKGKTAASRVLSPATYGTDVPAGSGGKSYTELFKVDLSNNAKIGYGVQVSTLSDPSNVLPVLEKLQTEWPGRNMVLVETNELEKTTKYKIIVGPYADKKDADGQRRIAARKGYKGCFVVDLSEM